MREEDIKIAPRSAITVHAGQSCDTPTTRSSPEPNYVSDDNVVQVEAGAPQLKRIA
jgi:hypothetical protein